MVFTHAQLINEPDVPQFTVYNTIRAPHKIQQSTTMIMISVRKESESKYSASQPARSTGPFCQFMEIAARTPFVLQLLERHQNIG